MDKDFDDVREEQRCYDSKRSRFVTWYRSRHVEDRYDETTDYHVAVFDMASREEIACLDFGVTSTTDNREVKGKHVTGASFGRDDDDIVVSFEDGTEEHFSVEENRIGVIPPDEPGTLPY